MKKLIFRSPFEQIYLPKKSFFNSVSFFLHLLGVLALVLFIFFSFSGCKELKTNYLKSKKYLKIANQYYQQDQYKNAIKNYEKALNFNKNLKKVHFYLGTCYAMTYQSGKKSEINTGFSKKAIYHYQKAKKENPQNKNIILAMGNIYEKMSSTYSDNKEKNEEYFNKAEMCYNSLLKKLPNNPKIYYTLAKFYSKHGKITEAITTYKKRIALDPLSPEGYLYYANYLQNCEHWDKAIINFEKMIYSYLDPSIIQILQEINKINIEIDKINKKERFKRRVLNNTKIPKKTKNMLVKKIDREIKELKPKEKLIQEIKDKNRDIKNKQKGFNEKLKTIKNRKNLSEAYYRLGVSCWKKSYYTRPSGYYDRRELIEKGMKSLRKAIKLNPNYAQPWAYIGLLYREMIKVEPEKRGYYINKNEEMNEKFKKLYKKKGAGRSCP